MRTFWVFALLLTCSCGVLTWKSVYVMRQRARKVEIRVEELCGPADCSVRIAVAAGRSDTTIAQRRDCVVMFAHAAWSGSVVGIFVDGSYCGTIKAAYDVQANRMVDFTSVEPWLREDIVRDYHVTPEELQAKNGDVLAWATYPGACCSRAKDEFERRRPQ